MNNLEEFIRSNREAFDDKQPREKLWTRIESDLNTKGNDYQWLWKAAVMVLLAVCGYLIWEKNVSQHSEEELVTELPVHPEFVETELYYTQLIGQQQRAVEEFDLNDPEMKQSFRNDLASLDTMYQQLKLEYVETSNEAVLEAMIGNLQLRMELLNEQLQILERISNEDKNEMQVEHL